MAAGTEDDGFLAALKGAATAAIWCGKNWKKLAAILPVLAMLGDQFVGPHVMRAAWHNVKRDQAQESAAEIAERLTPVLERLETRILEVKDEQILQHRAFENLHDGARAMAKAIRQRARDSAVAAEAVKKAKGWHPPEASAAVKPETRNVAIIGAQTHLE